jgi:hypothetical protein
MVTSDYRQLPFCLLLSPIFTGTYFCQTCRYQGSLLLPWDEPERRAIASPPVTATARGGWITEILRSYDDRLFTIFAVHLEL